MKPFCIILELHKLGVTFSGPAVMLLKKKKKEQIKLDVLGY